MELKSFKGGNFKREQGADRFFKKSIFMRNIKKCIFSIMSACLIGFTVFPVKQVKGSALGISEGGMEETAADLFTNGVLFRTTINKGILEYETTPTPKFYATGFYYSDTYSNLTGNILFSINNWYTGNPGDWGKDMINYIIYDMPAAGTADSKQELGIEVRNEIYPVEWFIENINNRLQGSSIYFTKKEDNQATYWTPKCELTFRTAYTNEEVTKTLEGYPIYIPIGTDKSYEGKIDWIEDLEFTQTEQGLLFSNVLTDDDTDGKYIYVEKARYYVESQLTTGDTTAPYADISFWNTDMRWYFQQVSAKTYWYNRNQATTPGGIIFGGVADFFQMEIFPGFRLYYFLLIGFGVMLIGLWLKIALGG